MPERPKPIPLPDKERPEFNTLYTPDRNSMGDFTGVTRPDDHPHFLQYLKNAKPALDLASTMLEKDYFLYNFPMVNKHHALYFPAPVNPHVIFGTWLAYANAQALFWDQPDQSIDTFNEFHNVLKLLSTESFDRYNAERGWAANWDAYFATLLNVVRNTDDAMLIQNIDAMLETQPLVYHDMQRVLHNELRVLDEALLCPTTLTELEIQFDMDLDDNIYLMRLQNVILFMRDQLPALEILADKPVTEQNDWMETSNWSDIPYTDYFDGTYTIRLMHALKTAQKINTYPVAIRLAIAVERFKKDNGKYPESSDSLVPDYIDSIPISPATQSPLIYALHEDRYEITGRDVTHYDLHGDVQSKGPFKYVAKRDFPNTYD